MPDVILRDGENVEDTIAMLKKTLSWLMANLDHDNVKRLFTEYCEIKSEDGSTEIVGPLLIMKDKQNTPVIRLLMGYNPASFDFVYQLMNAAGEVTVNIDSNGNLNVERGTFKGSITIGSGNNVFKADGATGIWLGHTDFASAPFRVGLNGAVTATNLTVVGGTITGATIIGGVIKTAASGARVELSSNQLVAYNASGNRNGLFISPGDNGDVYVYNNNAVYFIIRNLGVGGCSIEPINGASLGVGGLTGETTYMHGHIDFDGCTNVTGLDSWYATLGNVQFWAEYIANLKIAAHIAEYHL